MSSSVTTLTACAALATSMTATWAQSCVAGENCRTESDQNTPSVPPRKIQGHPQSSSIMMTSPVAMTMLLMEAALSPITALGSGPLSLQPASPSTSSSVEAV